MIVNTDNMLVCFVNTNQRPRKIERLGVFKYHIVNDKFYLSELCEVWYPHPEAPDEANIQLLDWINVEYTPGTRKLIENAIDAVKDIGAITTLIGISEETKVV
jgi:hypothetical protein